MPRLLLVDDNPSIHRIAESLLAPTEVELVCVDSAAEALDRLARGERFDVALVDTAMPGMDGWTLLGRLRALEATARMPIALMAGVLDPVDPAKLAKAPIQGFLKKPIELRELGDRVKALLATPVPASSPSPFSTVPATPAQDLVRKAEAALPEWRPEPEVPEITSMALPEPSPDEDLLLLTADDLWPEPVPAAAVGPDPAMVVDPDLGAELPDVQLELEELDLDSLQDLAGDPPPVPTPLPESPSAFDLDSILPEEDADELVTLSGLEDLATVPAEEAATQVEAHAQEPLPDAEGLAGVAAMALLAREQLTAPPSAEALPVPAPAPVAPDLAPAAAGQAPAAAGQATSASAVAPANAVSSEQARALVQALLADPVLVDALVKAVVSRMGDQVLREIAWEVMPDLAGRLQS